MIRYAFALLFAIFCMPGMNAPAQAQGPDWEFLGERHANLAADHDVIPVGIQDGRFRTIQLRVRGSAIRLMDLQVNFANGTTYNVPVRAVLRAGEQTRAIDLPGDLRIIRNVRMTYRTVGQVRRGRATVRLFGRRGQAQPAAVVQPAQPTQPTVAATAPGSWEFLGERHANLAADHDVIPVGIQDGRFRTIQLRVRGSAIRLMDLQVNFANGTTYNVPVRAVLRAGEQTRAIDLPGDLRIIRNVRMTYRTVGQVRRGRATVRLFGRRGQAQPAAVVQPAQPTQPNWELLGERVVNFRGDHDVIPVGLRDGRFRRIQLRVRGNAVHMNDLRVNFANGTTYDVPVRTNIASGGQTRAIDLPGDLRVIRNVRMTYRTRARRAPRGRATVRLFGSRH